MFSFYLSIFALLATVVAIVLCRSLPEGSKDRTLMKFVSIGAGLVTAILFLLAAFVTVPASNVAVVTTWGRLSDAVLTEGAHFIAPWSKTTNVYMGQQRIDAENSDAGSKDMQKVHADLVVNYVVSPGKARELYASNTSLTYAQLLLRPAAYEIFKAVIAQYQAEDLMTKREQVSAAITGKLRAHMAQYHLAVQNVNLVNFGFSKSFDAAIEEKVTASQKALTAQNNLARIQFEVQQRIAQATGEAQAIAIQSAAVEKSGGQGYVQLQAIQKWNGVLPGYVTSGSSLPFIGIK